jgi:PAS domain S-box-containing protein
MPIEGPDHRNNPLAQNIKIISGLFSESHLRENFLTSVVQKLQVWSDCQCVGIRVISREGLMPYEAYTGFSREFWHHENLLSLHKDQCGCIRIAKGFPDSLDLPIVTEGGSLCSNDLQEFGKAIPEEFHDRYRGKCIESGFASLAVLPIRHKSRIIGLIHLADLRKDMLPEEKILTLEFVAPAIGEVIMRFSSEEALERKEKFSARLIASMFDGFAVFDARWTLIDVNEALCQMTDFSRDELIGSRPPYLFYPEEHVDEIREKFLQLQEGEFQPIETELIRKNGERFPVVLSPSRLLDAEGKLQCYLTTIKDMSRLENARLQLAEKVDQLSDALEKIRQLEGVLPICMYCKKIRDDNQSWNQLEQYISDHSEAVFSHGICPECSDKRAHLASQRSASKA